MKKFLIRITDSNWFLAGLLIIGGILNFGWIFSPILGQIGAVVNLVLFIGIGVAVFISTKSTNIN